MADKQKILSLSYSLAAVFFWSTVATAFKLTLAGLSYASLLFYSSLASAALLFLILMIFYPKSLKSVFVLKSQPRFLLLGLFNPFLYYIILFKAYSLLPAQEAQPLNYTWPIMISIFSALFLGQKLTIKIIAGLLVSFTGVIIIATRGDITGLSFHDPLGVILAAGSSIIWASFWTLNLVFKEDNSAKLFASFFYGSFFTAVYIFFFDSFYIAEGVFLLGAAYIGIFEMGITFFLWLKGLELSRNKAATSTLAFLAPFVSMLFIWLILGEEIHLSSIGGLCLIIGGIVVQQSGRFGKKSMS